jgi:hypothetical protein
MSMPTPLVILPNERRGRLLGGWVGTLVFVAFISFFWFVFLTGNATGDAWVGYVVLGLFSLFCAGAVHHMVRVTLSVYRFGDVALRLHEPPRTGATLKGYLDLRRHEVLRTASLKLICNKVRWTRGSKGSRNRSETEEWSQSAERVPVGALGPIARVELSFAIPADLPGTTVPADGGITAVQLGHDYYEWKLELNADVPGVDLVRTYEVRMEAAAAAAPGTSPAPDASKIAAAGKIALADLASGKAPAAVAGRLEELGLGAAAVGEVLRGIAESPGSKNTAQLRPYLAARARAQAEMESGALLMLNRRGTSVNPASAARGGATAPESGFSLWRKPSAWVLLIANLVPVAGVLFFGWELLPVMLLFWLENVFVGFFNVLRLASTVRGGAEKFALIPFFIVHYGGFCAGHGLFVMLMFGENVLKEFGLMGGFPGPAALSTLIAEYGLVPAAIALFVSHGFSYFSNYLGKGEYLEAEPNRLMFAPYGRVVVLHIVILVGSLVLQALQSPAAFLALLVVLKTGLDLFAHAREHAKYAVLAAGAEAGGVLAARTGNSPQGPQGRMTVSAAVTAAAAVVVVAAFPAPVVRPPPQPATAADARPAAPPPSAPRIPQRPQGGAVPGPIVPATPIELPVGADPASAWEAQYRMADALRSQGRTAEAEQALRATLASMEAAPDGMPPESARVLSALADVQFDQGRRGEYEKAMQRALEVLDEHEPAAVRVRLGEDGGQIDRESLAREFGDYYWDQRRYDRGFEYYRRAHAAAGEVDVSAAERNRRLAFSSAGMMATACMMRNFEAADRAMQELRERIRTVDAGSKQKLDYWVRTGEPRLKDGRCGKPEA